MQNLPRNAHIQKSKTRHSSATKDPAKQGRQWPMVQRAGIFSSSQNEKQRQHKSPAHHWFPRPLTRPM